MNIAELLTDLQAQHDESSARASELCDQITHLTAALIEIEARLADLATTQVIITGRVPPGTEPDTAETNTACQTIVNAFDQHPRQEFRARELHELLGMPTDGVTVNITRSRLGRLTRQGFLTQPGRGL
ncbi:hypothetical protein [Streptomyces aureus]|uniref:hypothetical protein n=1 Tax=Streptomyces aureus TaxID=193461 RepID=UPI0033CAF482